MINVEWVLSQKLIEIQREVKAFWDQGVVEARYKVKTTLVLVGYLTQLFLMLGAGKAAEVIETGF